MKMNHIFRFNLRAKITLLTCIIALISASAVAWLNARSVEQVTMSRITQAFSAQTQIVSTRLEENFVKMVEDARVISLTPPVRGLIRTTDNDGADPLDGSTRLLWQSRLETIFSSIMEVRPSYTQIRYIGFQDGGREIVRVNRTPDGIKAVEESMLQKKGQESYMVTASSLQPGDVSFTNVTNNREFGKVDDALIPTIRVLLPVYQEDGSIFGVIIINANYEILLRSALARVAPKYDTIIINNHGDRLEYNALEMSTRLTLNADVTRREEEKWNELRFMKGTQLHRQDGNLFYNFPLKVISENSGLELDVLLRGDAEALLHDIRVVRNDSLILALILIIAGVSAAFYIALLITRPLRAMTRHIEAFGTTEETLDLPVQNSDEIGALARSFTDLLQRLEYSQKRTQNIVEHAVDGLIVIDENGTIESFNPACESIFGYAPGDVLGRNISMLMPNSDRRQHDSYMRNYKETGERKIIGVGRLLKARKKNGMIFPIELSISEMVEGDRRFFCGIVRDMTEITRAREEIEQQKRTLELALNSGELGLWDRNARTSELKFSARWAEMLGYDADELTSDFRAQLDMIHPDDFTRVIAAFSALSASEIDRMTVEFRMRHRAGHNIWVQCKGQAVEWNASGVPVRFIGTHLDISERKRTELAMAEQYRQLELAEATAALGHWSLDLETQAIFWSDGVYAIHGLTPETHTPDLESGINFYHPDDREMVAEMVGLAINEGKPFSFDMRLIRADGAIRHVRSKGEVLKPEGHGDNGVVFGVFQDITDIVEAEIALRHSEEKTRTVLENIVDGVITIGSDGIIDSCNTAGAALYGYTVAELVGQHLDIIFNPNVSAGPVRALLRGDKAVEDAMLGKTVELNGWRRSGESFMLELSASKLQLGGKTFYTGIVRDITERKQMEKMKSEFITTVNHELRTPLTSIYGSLDLLQRFADDQLDQKCKRLLHLAHEGCGRLSNLINDILDQEKIAAGKMEYRMEVVDVGELVEDIVSRHDGLAERFNVNFVVQSDCTGIQAYLDPSRFNQAVVNLLSNAAKFSPAGANVEVSTTLETDNRICIAVSDYGPGIPENFRKRIFEKFAQADASTTRKAAGTGLGLNITKSIIEAFDGTVTFESEVDVGTTFRFHLPVYVEQNREETECLAS